MAIFDSVVQAIARGYEHYDYPIPSRPDHHLVRIKTTSGDWALALAKKG